MTRFELRTWHVETAVAVSILLAVTAATATRPLDWIAFLAVVATFRHGQVTSRMSEAQASMTAPTIHCYRVAERYWVLKELLWLTFFVMQGSYAAVTGAVLFALYPAWRRFWRTLYPAGRNA